MAAPFRCGHVGARRGSGVILRTKLVALETIVGTPRRVWPRSLSGMARPAVRAGPGPARSCERRSGDSSAAPAANVSTASRTSTLCSARGARRAPNPPPTPPAPPAPDGRYRPMLRHRGRVCRLGTPPRTPSIGILALVISALVRPALSDDPPPLCSAFLTSMARDSSSPPAPPSSLPA